MWYEKVLFSTYLAFMAMLVGVVLLPRLSFFARLVLVVVCVNVDVDIFATYLNVSLHKETHLLYNLFIPFEYLFIYTLYIFNLKSSKHQIILIVGLALYIFLATLNLIFIQDIDTLNTYSYTIGALIIVLFAYLKLRIAITTDNLNASDIFLWFSLANIVFYTGALPVLLLAPIITQFTDSLADTLFLAKDIAYSLWSVLIAFGFICQKKII